MLQPWGLSRGGIPAVLQATSAQPETRHPCAERQTCSSCRVPSPFQVIISPRFEEKFRCLMRISLGWSRKGSWVEEGLRPPFCSTRQGAKQLVLSLQHQLVLGAPPIPTVTLKHSSPKLSVVLVQKSHLFLISQEDNVCWE